MKTNQLLKVSLPQGTLEIFHKTAMGNLTNLFTAGNIQRGKEGLRPMRMSQFLSYDATKHFISIAAKKLNVPEENILKKEGRGRSAKTYAQLHFLIYCAEKLSTDFHFDVIDIFINNNILKIRDDGGNAFKALNIAIDEYLPERENKNSNNGIYIQCATLLRDKVFYEENINYPKGGLIWNSKYATYEKMELRDEYENKLITLLQMDVVKNYEHLKELIGKL
ncbi:MAG: KilA-N domain-containing protein [Methylococcales bacterium]|nr:KilA-N domain-containing protein [Methylococcales bacterium]